MRASTVAPATSISASDSAVSRMIPLENASRWPRRVSQRGRKESSATKLARNGKPVKLVLPPVNKIAAVAAWSTRNLRSDDRDPGQRGEGRDDRGRARRRLHRDR